MFSPDNRGRPITLVLNLAKMVKLRLVCASFGQAGSVFGVEIDNALAVCELKDAIKRKKPDTIKCEADKMQLFLAKKDGEWLKDDETLDAMLLGGPDTSVYMMMRASWKLNKQSLFAPKVSLGEEVIHVLVVLPESSDISQMVERSANVVLEALRDSTDEWLAEFHTKRIKFDLLPSIASLPDFIEQPLPVKIRVSRNVLASWSSFPISLGDQVQKKMFVEDDVTPCESFRHLVLNSRMLKSLRIGTTENSFIWFWDTMIRSVLDFVFSEADIGRDSSKGSSTAKKRPDFCFILNEVCVFRGEEKEPGVDIKLPRSELEEKLIWSYGKVPYLFGYAASGFKIRLFALTRGINDAAGANTFQLGFFNLENLADRFRMVLALLNLCLLFPAITEECPDSGRNEYRNIHRSNGVVVRLNPTHIEKVFPNEEGFDQLERIYRIIINGKVPNVDRLIKLKRTTKTAKFEPRGTMVKPSNLLELFVALRNVLEALIVLHRELVIHRDIRWSNVIKRCDCDA